MFPPLVFPAITDRHLTAVNSATIRHLPDHRGRVIVTRIPTTGAASFSIRRQDASNKWQIVLNTNGSILLREHVAGVPTTRASAIIGSYTTGDIITWSARSTTITLRVNGSQVLTWASATNFATQKNGLWEAVADGDFDELTTTPP